VFRLILKHREYQDLFYEGEGNQKMNFKIAFNPFVTNFNDPHRVFMIKVNFVKEN
jgi:hypothetical protein